MSAPSSAPATTVRSPIGAFGPDIFASHLASLAATPAWWLDRKRAAFEKFLALPLPKRTDESWRFSNIASLTLDGFALLPQRLDSNPPIATSPFGSPALTFVNNRASATGADDALPE